MPSIYRYGPNGISSNDKAIYFDMDGTIANLYEVDGWCEDLDGLNERPYREAALMIDPQLFYQFAECARAAGWKLGIISWLSKAATTPDFDQRTVNAKMDWIAANLPPFDEMIFTDHGVPKYEVAAPAEAMLFDDEPLNRMHWDASGPLRRSYPADEMPHVMSMLAQSVSPAVQGGAMSVWELAEEADRRLAAASRPGNIAPEVDVIERVDGTFIVFRGHSMGYYREYEELVPISNVNMVPSEQQAAVLAKVDRIVYDLS